MLNERGGEAVYGRVRGSLLCAVNLAEILAKLLDRGYDERVARVTFDGFGFRVVALDEGRALAAGVLRARFRRSGLSFADCACLALADVSGLPALTADRRWAEIDHGIPVEVFR